MCLGSPRWPTIQFIKMIKDLKFILKQQRFLQSNTFSFLITNRNIQASWKMKFLRPRKVSSSSLKFKFPCMIFFQLSYFKFNSKICRARLENGVRRWHHCCDKGMIPVFKTKNLRQMLICKLDRTVNDRIQMWWLAIYGSNLMKYISKDWFCCRTFGLKVWTWVEEILNVLFFKSDDFS